MRHKWMGLLPWKKIQPRIPFDDLISSPRLGIRRLLFHTQTVRWRTDEEATERCRLFGFRSPDSDDPPMLVARTANDATRTATAWNVLRRGEALVYAGGDYHGARRLLSAVKGKAAGTSGPRKGKGRRAREEGGRVRATGTDGAAPLALAEEWAEQRELQRERSEIVRRILIRVSLEDGRPRRIAGLKRTPPNVGDVFSYAFQNDGEMNLDADGDEVSSPPPEHHLFSLAEFVAMVGGYEWHRKGVYVDALRGRVYPHFGVFPPTRQDYVELLEGVAADRTRTKLVRMMEIGIGTGVLSMVLLRRKVVDRVIGTDVNPYAVACAEDNMRRHGYRGELVLADLFPPRGATIDDEDEGRVDVVLFNPPWIPGGAATWLDKAVYDPDQNLLRRFLSQVQHHVNEDGRVYLLLSNLGMLLGLFRERDLHAMFHGGNLELVDVRTTEPRGERTKKKRTEKAGGRFDGVERAKAREIISLYHLRVRK